jgi:hypothetical protein
MIICLYVCHRDQRIVNECMKETEEIASKRRAFRDMRELLNRANEIVNEVRDFQPI